MYSISLQNIHPLTVLEEISAKGHFFSLILRENLKLPSWPFLPHIKHYQQHAPLLAHWWNHSKWSISLIIFFLWFSILLGRGPCILLHHPHSPGIILYVKMGRWIRPICTCLQSNKKVHLIRKRSNEWWAACLLIVNVTAIPGRGQHCLVNEWLRIAKFGGVSIAIQFGPLRGNQNRVLIKKAGLGNHLAV